MEGSGITDSPVDPRWFDAIPLRISRRAFDGRPIDSDILDRVDATCTRLGTSSGGARAVLLRETPGGVFTGMVGSYGAITDAVAALAFIGREASPVDVGYVGEAAILDATLVGLNSCWVAGYFDSEKAAAAVDLRPAEKVLAVTTLGYSPGKSSGTERLMHAFVKPRARLPLEEIAPGVGSWPQWAHGAADAVRVAPSGANAQPWRLRMENGALVVACKQDKPYWTWRIDCGIAMLHAELAALHEDVPGNWQRLEEPDVARFTPSGQSPA
jgi:hypothetical protein